MENEAEDRKCQGCAHYRPFGGVERLGFCRLRLPLALRHPDASCPDGFQQKKVTQEEQ